MFMRPDPAMDGLNHYAYCSGNPIMYNDPTGMMTKSQAAAAAKGKGAAYNGRSRGRARNLGLGRNYSTKVTTHSKGKTKGAKLINDALNRGKLNWAKWLGKKYGIKVDSDSDGDSGGGNKYGFNLPQSYAELTAMTIANNLENMPANLGFFTESGINFESMVNMDSSTDAGYAWPTSGILTQVFGLRKPPVEGATKYHPGMDIANVLGTKIVAAESGTVVVPNYHSGYGYRIFIKHADGNMSYYSHLSRILVNNGDIVTKGQIIAEMGNTGTYTTGSHLHYGIKNSEGKWINPTSKLSSPANNINIKIHSTWISICNGTYINTSAKQMSEFYNN